MVRWKSNKTIALIITTVIVTVSCIGLLLYGRCDSARLASTIRGVSATAQAQGYQFYWTRTRPDIAVVDLSSAHQRGYSRQQLYDLGSTYYLAFFKARLAAGYSIIRSSDCTVELDIQGHPISQRSGFISLCS